jgi:Domain of unknown function (DUF4412)
MNRLALLVLFGCWLCSLGRVVADDATPYAMSKQFSAEQIITQPQGPAMDMKIYVDNGKTRVESDMNGQKTISIIRPDQQKMYTVMEDQKMIMELPYRTAKSGPMAAVNGAEGKLEPAGPDTVDGIACTKYKMTGADGQVSYIWVDMAKQVPVKMASAAGGFEIRWKNFQNGPQDPALFEPPTGYQTMPMPGANN